MMSLEMVMELLAVAGEDLMMHVDADGDLHVVVDDFEGFDDDWAEVERDYDEELVESLEEQLEEAALSVDGDYYRYFQFEDFVVVWGYSSMDV